MKPLILSFFVLTTPPSRSPLMKKNLQTTLLSSLIFCRIPPSKDNAKSNLCYPVNHHHHTPSDLTHSVQVLTNRLLRLGPCVPSATNRPHHDESWFWPGPETPETLGESPRRSSFDKSISMILWQKWECSHLILNEKGKKGRRERKKTVPEWSEGSDFKVPY